MSKTAAIVVTTCAVLWLATIAGTVHWLARRAADGAVATDGPLPGRGNELAPPAADAASGQAHGKERLSSSQILNEHYAWFMILSLTLGLLVYLPVAWLAWLVAREPRRQQRGL